MKVRRAKPSDLSHCMLIAHETWSVWEADRLRDQMQAPWAPRRAAEGPPVFHVVERDPGCVVGFAGYRESWARPKAYELIGIGVAERYRHEGFGRLLTKTRLDEIRRVGGRYVTLATIIPNFFYPFGFRITDRAHEWTMMALDLG